MVKRGPKPKSKVKIKWSPEFAYALGLLATDGCVISDGRHINFTSKDKKQVLNFRKCLGLQNVIGRKSSGSNREKKYFVVQFGDVIFHKYLVSIGITPAKSKTMSRIAVPDIYFFDFLRGHFDGDGSSYSYWDPGWRSSFMFYMVFTSASRKHIVWLREMLRRFLGIRGHISKGISNSAYNLKYAKAESLKLFPKLYYNKDVICLRRKRLKIEKAFGMDTRYTDNN